MIFASKMGGQVSCNKKKFYIRGKRTVDGFEGVKQFFMVRRIFRIDDDVSASEMML